MHAATRSTNRSMARKALAAALCVGLAGTVAAVSAASLPVLDEPALVTPKALGVALFGTARAGQRLVAVGERGVVLLSGDDGVNWKQVQTPVQTTLTSVVFVDDRRGWAAGHLGVILHTEDGGITWTKQLDGVRGAALVEEQAQRNGKPEAIEAAKHFVQDGPDKPFMDLWFADARHGFAVGAYGLAFATDDGGKTWLPAQDRFDNAKGLHLYAVRGAGAEVYIAGEQGLLLRSTDSGAHFTPVATPYKGSYFGMVSGADGALVVFGLRGNAYRSADHGAHWDKLETGVASGLSGGALLADGSFALVAQTGEVIFVDAKGAVRRGAQRVAMPAAAISQARDGTLVVAGLRGVRRLGNEALPAR